MQNVLFFLITLIPVHLAWGMEAEVSFVNPPPEISVFGPVSLGRIQILDEQGNPFPVSEIASFFSDAGVTIQHNGDHTAEVTYDILQDQNFIANLLVNSGVIKLPIFFVGVNDQPGTLRTAVLCLSLDSSVVTISAESTAESSSDDEPTEGTVNDPVSTATREYFFFQRLLDVHSPLLELGLDLYYGSQNHNLNHFSFMAQDFSCNHLLGARKLSLFGGTFRQLQFKLGLGQFVTFEQTDPETEWTLTGRERWPYRVEETAGYYYLQDPGRHLVYIFKKHPIGTSIEPAHCIQIVDRNVNALSYTLAADPMATGPVAVSDGLGRSLQFTYNRAANSLADPRNYLQRVEDHTGRTIEFLHEEVNGRVRLASITDANGGMYHYAYDTNHFMTAKQMPEGNIPFTQTYEQIFDFNNNALGAVTSQSDFQGFQSDFSAETGIPGLGDKQVIVSNPDGTRTRHFHSVENTLTAIVDETGEKLLMSSEPGSDRFTGFTDRDGESTAMAYHEASGFISSYTDPLGNTTTYTYTESAPQTFANPETNETVQCAFFDLTRIDFADGTFVTLDHDAAGNVLRYQNRVSDEITVGYNARGQVLIRKNAAGGVVTQTYDTVTGLLDTMTDSDVGRLRF